jgi:short-subunit dehydrogenase
MNAKKYTLITGASCGLGKELAEECAKRGMHLLLTALPNENIAKTGKELAEKYRIDVQTFEADLTNSKEIREFAESISKKYAIEALINNAGLGGTQPFLEATPEYIEQIILLNINALVLITRFLLPNLKRQKRAYILNIASMAAFSPMPYKTVYPASKAFVYSFSRGLSSELKNTGISVSVAHPGGMRTNSQSTKSIENHNFIIRSTTLSVEKVAQICIKGMFRRRKLIIPGFLNKVSWLLLQITPVWFRLELMRSSIQKNINNQKNLNHSIL